MLEQNCPPAVSPWRLEHGRDRGSRLGLGLGLVRGRPRPRGVGARWGTRAPAGRKRVKEGNSAGSSLPRERARE